MVASIKATIWKILGTKSHGSREAEIGRWVTQEVLGETCRQW